MQEKYSTGLSFLCNIVSVHCTADQSRDTGESGGADQRPAAEEFRAEIQDGESASTN